MPSTSRLKGKGVASSEPLGVAKTGGGTVSMLDWGHTFSGCISKVGDAAVGDAGTKPGVAERPGLAK
jgi:hypothetical protein